MNRMTATAILLALTAWPGLFAYAQLASALDAKPEQTHGIGAPVMRCAHHDAGSRALQSCGATGEAMRIGSNVTRQELDCVLSGVCGATERVRLNG